MTTPMPLSNLVTGPILDRLNAASPAAAVVARTLAPLTLGSAMEANMLSTQARVRGMLDQLILPPAHASVIASVANLGLGSMLAETIKPYAFPTPPVVAALAESFRASFGASLVSPYADLFGSVGAAPARTYPRTPPLVVEPAASANFPADVAAAALERIECTPPIDGRGLRPLTAAQLKFLVGLGYTGMVSYIAEVGAQDPNVFLFLLAVAGFALGPGLLPVKPIMRRIDERATRRETDGDGRG